MLFERVSLHRFLASSNRSIIQRTLVSSLRMSRPRLDATMHDGEPRGTRQFRRSFQFHFPPWRARSCNMSRITFRTSLFYSMLSLGLLTLVTGFILYLWPHGPRSGQLIFLGLNRSEWGTWHTYITLIAIALIVVHLLENRKCVDIYVKTTLGKA